MTMAMHRNIEQDAEVAQRINAYLAEHKYPTRQQVQRDCKVSHERCLRMHKAGLIKYPLPMNNSIAATLNRKRNRIGEGWTISHKRKAG
jgi:hypothetical protein